MERYDFVVLDGRNANLVAREMLPPDPGALWRRVGRIARAARKPGLMIRVTNAAGGIVILVGVATALQLCAEFLNTLPQ